MHPRTPPGAGHTGVVHCLVPFVLIIVDKAHDAPPARGGAGRGTQTGTRRRRRGASSHAAGRPVCTGGQVVLGKCWQPRGPLARGAPAGDAAGARFWRLAPRSFLVRVPFPLVCVWHGAAVGLSRQRSRSLGPAAPGVTGAPPARGFFPSLERAPGNTTAAPVRPCCLSHSRVLAGALSAYSAAFRPEASSKPVPDDAREVLEAGPGERTRIHAARWRLHASGMHRAAEPSLSQPSPVAHENGGMGKLE